MAQPGNLKAALNMIRRQRERITHLIERTHQLQSELNTARADLLEARETIERTEAVEQAYEARCRRR